MNKNKSVSVNFIKMAPRLDLPPIYAKKIIKSKDIDFFYSLRPIYFVSRLFGLLPFSIIRDSSGVVQNARVNSFDLIWFFIALCIYLSMAWICYKSVEARQERLSYTMVIGDGVILTLSLINSANMIIMDMFNRFKFIEILKKFSFFDDEVIKNDIS